MKKKLLAAILMLAMAICMIPVVSFADSTQRTEALMITSLNGANTYGSVQDSDNKDLFVNEAEGWTWDRKQKVLTLNGVNINVSGNKALQVPDGTQINCYGENYITCTGTTGSVYGINACGTVRILGPESLTVTSSSNSGASFGIVSNNGGLLIGGNINLDVTAGTNALVAAGPLGATESENPIISLYNGANVTAKCTGNDKGAPVYTENGKVYASGSSQLTTEKGLYGIQADCVDFDGAYEVKVSGASQKCIWADNGDVSINGTNVVLDGAIEAIRAEASGNACVDISDGSDVNIGATTAPEKVGIWAKNGVSICAKTNVSVGNNNNAKAIYAESGNIEISGAEVTSSINNGTDSDVDNSEGEGHHQYSICAANGNVSIINRADVTSLGGAIGIIANGSDNGKLTIDDSQVESKAGITALWSKNDLLISRGEVQAKASGATGTTAKAIYSNAGDITINDESNVNAEGKDIGVRSAAGALTVSDGTILTTSGKTASVDVKTDIIIEYDARIRAKSIVKSGNVIGNKKERAYRVIRGNKSVLLGDTNSVSPKALADGEYMEIYQEDYAGDFFVAKGKAYTKSIKYSWSAVPGATQYKVYVAKCGKKTYSCAKKTSATTYTKKNLKGKSMYKAYVVAYNSAGKKISKTPTIHLMTKGGNKSNALAVTALKTIKIDATGTKNVKASITKKDSKKGVLYEKHCAKLRYYSADSSVATVDAAGNVSAAGNGKTNIYTVAADGVFSKTEVSVNKVCRLTFKGNSSDWEITKSVIPVGSVLTVNEDKLELNGEVIASTKVSVSSIKNWLIDGRPCDGQSKVIRKDTEIEVTTGCVLAGTQITLADGSKKNVEDITYDDELKTFNFFAGSTDSNKILSITQHKNHNASVMHVFLDNGKVLDLCDWQCLFDMDEREYFDLTPKTADSAVGRNIMYIDGDAALSGKITSITQEEKQCDVYEIYTEYDMNFIANDVITLEPMTWLQGLYVINDDLKVDQEQLKADAEKYGLYEYDQFAHMMSKHDFEAIRLADRKIAVGKGLITEQELFDSGREWFDTYR